MTTDTLPRPPRRLTKRLSAAFVRTAPPGFYCDGGHGLNLRVDPSGARRWVQRLVIRGHPRMLGLGGYPLVSLAEAREAAVANRQRARAGGDPLAERRHRQGLPTVEEAAAAVLAQQRPGWRNAKHAREWLRSLHAYAFPRIGTLSVSIVTTADVLAILTPIWHVAVAIDSRGIRLGAHSFGADSEGYRALLTWAEAYGGIEAVGIEGTGGYGVGLSRTVHRAGHRVVEVNRVDRRLRRAAGKSDTIDAEAAARAVLAGQATATPKTADGAVEMMRQLKVARDSAVKARTTAMSTLKQILVNAPPVLREPLQALTDRALVTRCAGLRPGPLDTPVASGQHTLRSLARRWLTLADDSTTHDLHLARLTAETSPTLREGFAVGANTAAAMLIIFGDNPERIRSEAAFAKLCGACPVPASSGMTTGRHRLYRGGHRQANAALHRAVVVRMRYHQPTIDYVIRRRADGRTKRDIIRCLKRFLAREIYQRVMRDFRTRQQLSEAS